MLIPSQNEEGFIPLRGVAHRLVDAFHEVLAHVDGRRWMHGHIRAALGVDPSELRQVASLSVRVELRNGHDVVFPVLRRPVVEQGIWQECRVRFGRVLIVLPCDALIRELLEDGLLGECGGHEVVVVLSVAVRGARGQVGPVGVGGTWDGGKPAIKQHEVLRNGVEDGDVVRGEVVDCFSGPVEVILWVGSALLADEPIHGRLGSGDRMIGAEDLHVTTGYTVVGVVGGDVLRDGVGADLGRIGKGNIGRVAELRVLGAIDARVIVQATSKVVKRQILLHQDHDVLNVIHPGGGGKGCGAQS